MHTTKGYSLIDRISVVHSCATVATFDSTNLMDTNAIQGTSRACIYGDSSDTNLDRNQFRLNYQVVSVGLQLQQEPVLVTRSIVESLFPVEPLRSVRMVSQAVSFPPTLGIEWDLYWHVHLAEEDQFEPAVEASSDVAPLFLAEPLRSGHVRGSKT